MAEEEVKKCAGCDKPAEECDKEKCEGCDCPKEEEGAEEVK